MSPSRRSSWRTGSSGKALPGRLTWKYIAIFASLVVAALLASGLTEAYFSYHDNKREQTKLQLVKAASAAARIKQFIDGVHTEIAEVAQTPAASGAAGLAERRVAYLRLLQREASVSAVTYLDPHGRVQLLVSRYALDHEGPGQDDSRLPPFLVARAKGTYYGPVMFLRGSRPHIVVAVAESPAGRGVVEAEVDLQFIESVITQARVGSTYAYAVDAEGRLVAHPNINLVLGRVSISDLPQVHAALVGAAKNRTSGSTTGRNRDGTRVLSAFQTVDPPGWRVFVEEPLSVADAPLKSALLRTALLLVAFLLLAIATSVVLARRLVRPITSMQEAAARIGEGELDHRLDVPRSDELGLLADEFNRMAARLQESYAGLEEKVDERTRELTTTLAELDEKSRQLETVSRHKSEFLATMSHELRSPLNAIIGFSEVLREQMFGDLNEKQLDYLDDVLESAQHLLAVINDILDLAKVEAGRIELELGEVSLPEALRSGLTMHEPRANRGGVALGLTVEPDEIVVEADDRKVRQVVFNLVSNAVKFTPAGGRVDVSARLVDGVVVVAIADTGPGIELSNQELIFAEFQQARVPGDGVRIEGTGLGLPLARKFIELHGGRLWVESTPGTGSIFRFTLPVRQRG
jgi:signal transduction histidine kinase